MYKTVFKYENNSFVEKTLQRGLTEQEAQTICNNPETSSRTFSKEAHLIHKTKKRGPWFVYYTKE